MLIHSGTKQQRCCSLLQPEASCPLKLRGTCPLRFLSQVDFECSSKRQKIAESYFYIWYNNTGILRSFSASNHQLLNSNLSSLADAKPETGAFLQRCIITNHTRFCWPYECNGQSEAFRWVTAETWCFVLGVRSQTEFSGELSYQKQQSAEVRTM